MLFKHILLQLFYISIKKKESWISLLQDSPHIIMMQKHQQCWFTNQSTIRVPQYIYYQDLARKRQPVRKGQRRRQSSQCGSLFPGHVCSSKTTYTSRVVEWHLLQYFCVAIKLPQETVLPR